MALNLGSNDVTVEVSTSNGDSRTYVTEIRRGAKLIEQTAYGKASNTSAYDQWGWSVSLSGDTLGDTLAVGAPVEDSNATGIDGDQADNSVSSSGAIYLFQ